MRPRLWTIPLLWLTATLPLASAQKGIQAPPLSPDLSQLRAQEIVALAACPGGERLALGRLRGGVEIKEIQAQNAQAGNPAATQGFLLLQAEGSHTWTVIALLDEAPRALTCTAASGSPAAYIASDSGTGTRLTRLDPGTRQVAWTTILGGQTVAQDLAADERGQLFALLDVNGSWGSTTELGGSDLLVVRLSDQGQTLWSVRSGTSGDDQGRRLGLLGTTELWVAGTTTGQLQGKRATERATDDQDALLLRLLPRDGRGVLTRQFGSAGHDRVTDLLVTPGGVWLSGYTYGDLAGPAQGGADAFLLALTRFGDLRWKRQQGTPAAEVYSALAAWTGEDVLATLYRDTPERQSEVQRIPTAGLAEVLARTPGTLNALIARPAGMSFAAGGVQGAQPVLQVAEASGGERWSLTLDTLQEHLLSQEVKP